MENLNSPAELERLKTKVLQQLQTLQGAPSVQMIEVCTCFVLVVCDITAFWRWLSRMRCSCRYTSYWATASALACVGRNHLLPPRISSSCARNVLLSTASTIGLSAYQTCGCKGIDWEALPPSYLCRERNKACVACEFTRLCDSSARTVRRVRFSPAAPPKPKALLRLAWSAPPPRNNLQIPPPPFIRTPDPGFTPRPPPCPQIFVFQGPSRRLDEGARRRRG